MMIPGKFKNVVLAVKLTDDEELSAPRARRTGY
jgi:hypothetical protein